MIKPFYEKKHAQPICWINDTNLVLFQHGNFILLNVDTFKEEKLGSIILSKKERFFMKFSLTRRLLRLLIYSPLYNEKESEILFTFNGCFCSFNLVTKAFDREVKLRHNAKRILAICKTKNNEIFYGEYPTKSKNNDVSIFKRSKTHKHEIVYTFENNSVRHIHFLTEHNNDLFCFTGDENKETKILRFLNKDFIKKPIEILSGSQEYRSCCGLIHENNLVYLTDTPYCQNKLVIYNFEKNQIVKTFNVEGTTIYGLNFGKNLFFSTCVEYNLAKNNEKNVVLKIDGKNGGVRSKWSTLYCFNCETQEIVPLFKCKKDFLSIKYFGIGTFMFTSNCSKKYLSVFNSSLVHNENLYVFKINRTDF